MSVFSVGDAADIIQVFGFGLVLMIGLRILEILDVVMFWLSVIVVIMAFIVKLAEKSTGTSTLRPIWYFLVSGLLVTVCYAVLKIGTGGS